MQQKRIIIIGASSGIGEGLTKFYAKRKDFKIGITGRRKENLESLKLLNPENIEISSFDINNCDINEELSKLANKIGGLDILIISAGVGYRNPEMNYEKEMITIQTNAVSFTKITLWGFNYFKKQGYGHIVGISSIAGIRGIDLCPSYSATKGFEAIYLESLRRKSYQEKLNITITTVIPGFVNTVMAQGEHVFWRCSVEKAAIQIAEAIDKKRGKVYITKRWRYIASILKIIPHGVIEKL